MEKTEQKEKRRMPRTNLGYAVIEVYSKNIQNQADFRGRICDISPLGVRLISYKRYEKDSKVYVGLMLPNQNSYIYVSGKVRHWEQQKGGEYHIGIEFENSDYCQKSLIEYYINIMKSQPK